MPQLRQEIGQGHKEEGQGRVEVVLERSPVYPGPGEPLPEEGNGYQGQAEAPPLEGLPADERHAEDRHPPQRGIAAVVDPGRHAGHVAAAVEPDRLEVQRPGPPRRRCRVGLAQIVVVGVHALTRVGVEGQVPKGLTSVASRPGAITYAGLLIEVETGNFRPVSYTHLTLPTNREV